MIKKKKVTQGDVARTAGLDQGSVSRILNKDTRGNYTKDTVEKVLKSARELGYLHPSLFSSNRRDSRRKKCHLKAHIKIVIGTNTVYDEGDAVVSEISTSGVLISSMITKKMAFPIDRFFVDLDFYEKSLSGESIRAEVVRFAASTHMFSLAVKFLYPSDDLRDKIKDFIGD